MAVEAAVDTYAETLCEFELKFHDQIFSWISLKIGASETIELLNLSHDRCIFTGLLANRLKISRLFSIVSDEHDFVFEELKINTTKLADLSSPDLLGHFDVIILKDLSRDPTEDVRSLFIKMAGNLKPKTGQIFVLIRPKHPPLPMPDSTMETWRKLALSREEIVAAARSVGFTEDCFTVSCPIQMERERWGTILKSRTIPAIRKSSRCTDREINEFVGPNKSRDIVFEEKYLIILLKFQQ